MTRLEKECVIRALKIYSQTQERLENEARQKGQLDLAGCYNREKNLANANITTFEAILDEPCGAVKI